MSRLETCGMAVVIHKGNVLTISEMVFGRIVLSLPKGHQDDGEDILDTAIRECFEETNIQLNRCQLVCELTPYSYEFTSPSNTLVRKTVYPFLFETDDPGEPRATEKTMVSVDWMTPEDFFETCTYDSVKAVVNEALIKL